MPQYFRAIESINPIREKSLLGVQTLVYLEVQYKLYQQKLNQDYE